MFRIKALTGSPQDDKANAAIHVVQGETETGSVAFQVPDGVKVAQV